MLTMSLRDGRAHQLLWPNNPEFGRMVSIAAIGLQQIFLVLFSISFLRTRQYAPTLHALLITLLIVLSLATFLVVPVALGWIDARPAVQLLTTLGFPTVILLIVAGPLVWARGHPAARYYAIAQTVPLVFGITDLFFGLGILAIPAGVSVVPRLGTVLLVFFFSLALADNVQVLRRHAE
ncbi:MAG: 7TM-DISM domain-containing protein, partial [Anaerolineae bacterium]|nr:7TM-DISM domain-containing protein [Anaerolineae bacterium]